MNLAEKIKWRKRALEYYWKFKKELNFAKKQARIDFNGKKGSVGFIAGCGRSGTTVLGKLLSLHRDISYLMEPRPYWIAVNKHTDLWGYCNEGIHDLTLMSQADIGKEKKRFANIFYHYRQRSGCKVLVEKTPENIFRLLWLTQLAEDAKIIFIVRNGNDVARSIDVQSRRNAPFGLHDMDNWYGVREIKKQILKANINKFDLDSNIVDLCNKNIEWGALEWIFAMRSKRKYGVEIAPSNMISVTYEELIDNPWSTYKQLLDFLALAEYEGLQEQVVKTVRKRKNNPEMIPLPSPLKEIFSKEMELAGYLP